MEDLLNLLEVVVAVILVVAAVSLQLETNRRQTVAPASEFSIADKGDLSYACTGAELLAHLRLVLKKEESFWYEGLSWQYANFCEHILQITISPDRYGLSVSEKQRLDAMHFTIWNQDGIWRVEND